MYKNTHTHHTGCSDQVPHQWFSHILFYSKNCNALVARWINEGPGGIRSPDSRFTIGLIRSVSKWQYPRTLRSKLPLNGSQDEYSICTCAVDPIYTLTRNYRKMLRAEVDACRACVVPITSYADAGRPYITQPSYRLHTTSNRGQRIWRCGQQKEEVLPSGDREVEENSRKRKGFYVTPQMGKQVKQDYLQEPPDSDVPTEQTEAVTTQSTEDIQGWDLPNNSRKVQEAEKGKTLDKLQVTALWKREETEVVVAVIPSQIKGNNFIVHHSELQSLEPHQWLTGEVHGKDSFTNPVF
ncbi:uncharacterized protein [Nothobranchius furzeri]|uniref:uncharacterized protein n=1 Tax=Nothobranchius furzeri TaxID=105023 RepID=UPI0039048DDB